MQIEHAWERLHSILSKMPLAVLAYSGGVDSALLLRAAAGALGPNLLAVTALSDTYPSGEIESAKAYAASLGVRHRIVHSEELTKEQFARNDRDRCYYCKRELFAKLKQIADAEGIPFILDGSNVDDLSDHRPGRRAAEEFAVRSPLIEAGLNKQCIRDLARRMNLPMWDKPSLACLSSRIPYGTRITADLLHVVQSAEDIVRNYGVRQVRVRHHGDTARIEVDHGELGKLVENGAAGRLAAALKALGYRYVTLDLEGYRTGSMNAAGPGGGERGGSEDDRSGQVS